MTLAGSGAEALQVVRNVAVDVVLFDSVLLEGRGESLRKQVQTIRPGCRVLQLTPFAAVKGTRDLLRFGEDDFLLRKSDMLDMLFAPQGSAEEIISPVAEKSKAALLEVLDVTVGLLELGDKYFGGSSHQAMLLSRAIAEELSSEDETKDEVAIAALLRDIGRAGVERDVIGKTGELDDKQVLEIQGHVESGVRLLEHIDFPWKVLPVIRHHHERYDGRGYPDGLRGREIPIGARILAVVDAYLAMVSERPHRAAIDTETAFEELIRHAGTQFDPEVVEVFVRVMEKNQGGRRDQGRLRILIADPNEEYRNLLKLRLVNLRYEVDVVATPDEAMVKLLDQPVDLVLADANAANNDAIQLVREMRDNEALRTMPFILLADRDDRVLKVRALRLGVDDFVLKDVDLEELIARVENVLTRESQRREKELAPKHRGLTGRIESMGLPDILQTLHIGMKTALVTLTSGKQSGKIWFEAGAIVHAKLDKIEGEDAFFTMLRWTEGEFTIEHGLRGKGHSVTSDPMYLLMEGLRLIDEDSMRAAEDSIIAAGASETSNKT